MPRDAEFARVRQYMIRRCLYAAALIMNVQVGDALGAGTACCLLPGDTFCGHRWSLCRPAAPVHGQLHCRAAHSGRMPLPRAADAGAQPRPRLHPAPAGRLDRHPAGGLLQVGWGAQAGKPPCSARVLQVLGQRGRAARHLVGRGHGTTATAALLCGHLSSSKLLTRLEWHRPSPFLQGPGDGDAGRPRAGPLAAAWHRPRACAGGAATHTGGAPGGQPRCVTAPSNVSRTTGWLPVSWHTAAAAGSRQQQQ